jgi:predicted glycosyltransferase
MIEQIARLPRIRDAALFVGSPDDVVETEFGPGLPRIRDWTREHFDFPGYILPFDPTACSDREGLRARLGFRADEKVVFAAVGGTGVGHHLLRRVIAAAPATRRLLPDARIVVVTGPRIDPASLPAARGVEYRRFVPDLYAHPGRLRPGRRAGGLSTCMELTATKRPFLYFPLRNHFEQSFRATPSGPLRRRHADGLWANRPRGAGPRHRRRAGSVRCSTGTWKPTVRAAAAAVIARLV